jgi:hypothetical protein
MPFKRAVHSEYDRLRLESPPEIMAFVMQVLANVYCFILIYTLYRKPFTNHIMNYITICLVSFGLMNSLGVMIYDWIYIDSHWWRFIMLSCGSITVFLTTIQQLQIMKAFVVLSKRINPNHILKFQIGYGISLFMALIGSFTEDFLYYEAGINKLMEQWGTYGRIYQAISTTIITNVCSIYMLQLVYKHTLASKKTLEQEKGIVFKNYSQTIWYIVMQLGIDLVGASIFIVASPIHSYVNRDVVFYRSQYALSRIATSLMIIRILLQGKVFNAIIKVKFYKHKIEMKASLENVDSITVPM